MDIQLKKCEQLTTAEWQAWGQFQQTNPELVSPYFHPQFAKIVGEVRDDVEVGVLYEQNEPVGFFPFQRQGRDCAKPLAGRLSDYQGIISAEPLTFSCLDLMKACQLKVFDFDHLLTNQAAFQPYHQGTDDSPYLDLSAGYTEYRQGLSKSGNDEIKQTERKTRKFEREVAKLRWEFCTRDSVAFEKMLEWKSDQYHRTQVTDVFSFDWTRELLERLLACEDPDFGGIMSVLYADEQPVAVHVGMRCRHVLHWWFPTYSTEYAKYSTGRMLLLRLAQSAPEHGMTMIDLGRGMADYKKRMMSGAVSVAQGTVDLRPIARNVRLAWQLTREYLRNSPLRAPARVPAKMLYHMKEWIEFR